MSDLTCSDDDDGADETENTSSPCITRTQHELCPRGRALCFLLEGLASQSRQVIRMADGQSGSGWAVPLKVCVASVSAEFRLNKGMRGCSAYIVCVWAHYVCVWCLLCVCVVLTVRVCGAYYVCV